MNLIQSGLERSTRFRLENFAHVIGIQSLPERSILHYSNPKRFKKQSTRFKLENPKRFKNNPLGLSSKIQSVLKKTKPLGLSLNIQSGLERSTRFNQENYFILINHLYENNILTIIITIITITIINNFRINKTYKLSFL